MRLAASVDMHPGLGWLAVAAVVLAFDVANVRSLTSHARRWPRTSLCLAGILALHLHGSLPERLDPFHYAALLLRRPGAA